MDNISHVLYRTSSDVLEILLLMIREAKIAPLLPDAENMKIHTITDTFIASLIMKQLK